MQPTVVLYVRIPPELMDQIDRLAYEARPRKSRQKIVTELLSDCLKRSKRK